MGVIAGTTALFLVLSVFSGIKNYSLNILDNGTPDVRISPTKGKTFIANTTFLDLLETSPFELNYAKVLQERAFLKNKQKEEIAYVKGIDRNFSKTIPIDSLIVIGEWFAPQSINSCVIDYSLAIALDLNVYTHKLNVFVPKPGKGYINNPKTAFKQIKPQVIGITSRQNQSDQQTVYLPLLLAQELLSKKENEVSNIDIKLIDQKDTDEFTTYLKSKLPDYNIQRKEEINGSFYKILNSEKLIAYLVSLLVILMVLSNTSGTLIMVIVDKRKDIETLLNMGAGIKNIRRIFATYGILLNLAGMVLGIVLGLFLVWLQLQFSLIMITPIVAYPIAFEVENIVVVCITIVLLGSLSSLLASSRITRKYVRNRA